ncbi:hypothetical protein C8Q76DRAFT_797999 [Earliella scabrosa]|nr:hypothetical protein C8Q76DRAFT_797999 [Earliella scabrosa]
MSPERRYTEPAQEQYYCPVCATLLSIHECERSGHVMEGCKYVECYHSDTSYVGWPKRFLWVTEPAEAPRGCQDAVRTLKNTSAAMWGSFAAADESKAQQSINGNEAENGVSTGRIISGRGRHVSKRRVSDRQAAMIKVESSRKKQGKEVERKRLQGQANSHDFDPLPDRYLTRSSRWCIVWTVFICVAACWSPYDFARAWITGVGESS